MLPSNLPLRDKFSLYLRIILLQDSVPSSERHFKPYSELVSGISTTEYRSFKLSLVAVYIWQLFVFVFELLWVQMLWQPLPSKPSTILNVSGSSSSLSVFKIVEPFQEFDRDVNQARITPCQLVHSSNLGHKPITTDYILAFLAIFRLSTQLARSCNINCKRIDKRIFLTLDSIETKWKNQKGDFLQIWVPMELRNSTIQYSIDQHFSSTF